MNTQDIELPPLPPLYIVPSVEPVDYPEVAQVLMDYARTLIEADRKRRGEPVAKVRDRGFEVEDGKHVPTVLVEFPVDDWESRDRFAAAVDAPQPLSESDIPAEPHPPHRDCMCAECAPSFEDHPTEPGEVQSVDIDDFIAAFIARGDITKDAFLEARQWVRDTYYNPAEPVKTLIDNQEPLGEEFQRVLDEHSWDLYVKTNEPVKVPSDDALEDALSNLEHDNYEQSYSGYKNRQADIALIRTALTRYKQHI